MVCLRRLLAEYFTCVATTYYGAGKGTLMWKMYIVKNPRDVIIRQHCFYHKKNIKIIRITGTNYVHENSKTKVFGMFELLSWKVVILQMQP